MIDKHKLVNSHTPTSLSGIDMQGRSQNLKLEGAVFLLVSCGGSSFRLSCLTANEFFFFFFVFFMCASKYGQNYFFKKILKDRVVCFR